MHRRRGISLLELMLTLSACIVILTMSAGLIHRAMHAQTKARLFFDVERSACRLGDSFRRDVHAAKSAAVGKSADGKGVLLRLQLAGDQSVEYHQTAGRVERLWHVDGNVRAREMFVFPRETRLQAKQEPPRLLILSIVPPDDAADAGEPANRPLRPYLVPAILQVEAVLGRNASLVESVNMPELAP
jgi:hypothetical protein